MSKGRVLRLLLGGLCVLSVLRLAGFAVSCVRDVLQLDLAAYVTAGEALKFGLDPYRTHPDYTPPIWDGKSAYQHSRFLYPPLVAMLFRPLAALPYLQGKGAFTLLSVLALGAVVLLLWREVGSPSPERLMLVIALVAAAFPVLTLVERGQVDAFTLLLVVLAFRPALQGRPPGFASGALLALATLLKLNAGYLALFVALRRWWRALLGLAVGGGALLALDATLQGPSLLAQYVREELPRIARYGEDGTPAMRLDEEAHSRLRGDAPEGFTRKDGRLYRVEAMGFVANASGARTLALALGFPRPRAAAAPLSLVILAASLAFAAWAIRAHPPSRGPEELAFLVMALAALLLAGPLTWAMNVTWLAAGVVLLAVAAPGGGGSERASLAGLTLGLVLAGIPDPPALEPRHDLAASIGQVRYVIAELVVLLSTGVWLRTRSRAGATDREPV